MHHPMTILESSLCSGSFELAYATSLSKLASSPAQQFVRPDYYGPQATWYRLAHIDALPVAIQVTKDGIVSWISPREIETARIQQKVKQLLVPLPLPDGALNHLPADLAHGFAALSPMVHVASESLWEALAKGIIRQVITASQARRVLHQFIIRFGEAYSYNGRAYYNFPTIERLLRCSLDDLSACGLGFKSKTLLNLAYALATDNLESQIRATDLESALKMLQAIKGIGDWTARVALCDFTANWDCHPCDLAVITWARKYWTTREWPPQAVEFSTSWMQTNGIKTGIITAYLLNFAQGQSWLDANFQRLVGVNQ